MTVVYVVLALVAGAAVGYFARRYLASGRLAEAERDAERLLRDARREAETTLKEARLEAKEELHKVRGEVESELRSVATSRQDRAADDPARRAARNPRAEQDRRQQSLYDREETTRASATSCQGARRGEAGARAYRRHEPGPGRETCCSSRPRTKSVTTWPKMVRAIEEEARREGDRRSRNILSLSIQRTAANHVAETTVSVVTAAVRRHERPHHRP